MSSKCQLLWGLVIGILFVSCKERDQLPKETNPSPAQASPAPSNGNSIIINIDKSPLDMAYYPDEYPQLKMSGNYKLPLIARVIYSRPKKEGRRIFGDVLKYGSRWRLGANEATEIELFQDVVVQGQRIRKNRYVLYCIPFEDKWTIIFNSDLFTWGLKFDSSKDVHRFDIPVSKSHFAMEYYTMGFEKSDKGMNLVMAWDTVQAKLPIDLF